MGLQTELDGLAAAITAAGVPATYDENEVGVPGAWLRAMPIKYDAQLLDGTTSSTARVDVYLIVGAGSTGPAQKALAELYDQIVPDLLVPDDAAEWTAVALPSDPTTPLPALRLPVDLNLD